MPTLRDDPTGCQYRKLQTLHTHLQVTSKSSMCYS